MLSYMMKASITQLQGTSMYVSILDRWGFSSRAAEADQEFQQRVSHSLPSLTGPAFQEVTDTVQNAIAKFPISQCYVGGEGTDCTLTFFARILGMVDLCCWNFECQWNAGGCRAATVLYMEHSMSGACGFFGGYPYKDTQCG
ncbi:unnamed protein product [Symbiodinium necroappetens]|uniref:Uncharacterized protein n=1 Tax=Symbiodinium necroappetens TaxID=1628268 RepID=A0A812WRU6_9DINO|nr:unnamed protein product [Symbiodinium necroappetens]